MSAILKHILKFKIGRIKERDVMRTKNGCHIPWGVVSKRRFNFQLPQLVLVLSKEIWPLISKIYLQVSRFLTKNIFMSRSHQNLSVLLNKQQRKFTLLRQTKNKTGKTGRSKIYTSRTFPSNGFISFLHKKDIIRLSHL